MAIETVNWLAWLDQMPSSPHDLHVIGEVRVGNPGVEAFLTRKYPENFNPTILMLDLHLTQRAGQWTDNESFVQARFDTVVRPKEAIHSVEIRYAGALLITLQVEIAK